MEFVAIWYAEKEFKKKAYIYKGNKIAERKLEHQEWWKITMENIHIIKCWSFLLKLFKISLIIKGKKYNIVQGTLQHMSV